MIVRTVFALTAAICFVTEIASAQVTPAPMMNPAAPAAPATALPHAKKCQQNPNGGCKKKKKKKNKNKNASTGAPPQQGSPQQAPPQQQAPHPMTTP